MEKDTKRDEYESGRDGSMLGEFGWKNGRGGLEQVLRRGQQKQGFQRLGRSAALEWILKKMQQTQNKKVVRRLLDKNFSLFREYNLQRRQSKQEELGRRRDDVVTKNDNYEGFDEENQIKRKCGRWKSMIGYWVTVCNREKAWSHAGWEDTIRKEHE